MRVSKLLLTLLFNKCLCLCPFLSFLNNLIDSADPGYFFSLQWSRNTWALPANFLCSWMVNLEINTAAYKGKSYHHLRKHSLGFCDHSYNFALSLVLPRVTNVSLISQICSPGVLLAPPYLRPFPSFSILFFCSAYRRNGKRRASFTLMRWNP